MPYSEHSWVNGGAPALNATHLNEMEAGIGSAPYGPDAATDEVAVWNGSAWVYQKLTHTQLDAAAGILATQLAGSIPYSKLSLSGSVVDADIATAANLHKLAGVTGTPDGTKFLRDDGAWAAPSGGVTWTHGSSPPGSPADGDIWVFPADDTNGVEWMFRYDSSETTYKWRFIGGPPMYSEVATKESTSSLSFVDLATVGPQIIAARAGDYLVRGFATASNSTANDGAQFTVVNSSVFAISTSQFNGTTAFVMTLADENKGNITAGAAFKMQYQATLGGTAYFQDRRLSVIPIRVI